MSEQIPLFQLGQPEGNLSERRDAAANRLRILEVADVLFAEQGVADVSMADIAQAAGVGKGTLYRNFNNKGELCLALMDTQLRDFQDAQLARMRDEAQEGIPYMEQLARFLGALVHFSSVHMPLLYEVQKAGGILGARDLQRPHYWQYMTVRGLLWSAMRSDELPPEFDAEFFAEALLAPLAPHSFHFQRQILGFDEERFTAGMRLLLDGFRSLSAVPA